MRKVFKIPEAIYAAWHEGKLYDFNPTTSDIQNAIEGGQLENRGYQSHKGELEDEWAQCAKGSIDEICRLQKNYHARRIAHFVVHGWEDPIILAANGDMIDGTHRLKAAIHKRMHEVEIKIA